MVGRQVLKKLKELDVLPQTSNATDTDIRDDERKPSVNRFSLMEVNKLIEDEEWNPEEMDDAMDGRKVSTCKKHRHRKKKEENKVKQLSESSEKMEQNPYCYLFQSVNSKFLSYEEEMNRKIGLRSHVSPRHHSDGTFKLKKLFINNAISNIPHLDISMECIDGCRTYKYFHGKRYQEIEQRFIHCLSNTIEWYEFVQQHSNHLNSLLQMGEIFRLHEDFPSASQVTERLIYILQHYFHPHFQIHCHSKRSSNQLSSLLPYKFYENRIFHIALFRHAWLLYKRGLQRTALEICKVLLNTDPDDPLAVVLMIDAFAIKAGQFQFLVDFYNQFCSVYYLNNLPGMMFHYALALFKLERHDEARESMTQAIKQFPGTFRILLDELSIEPDPKTEKELQALDEDPIPLKILNILFMERLYQNMWKSPEVLKFIETSAPQIITKPDNSLYMGTIPTRVCRHIVLAQFSRNSSNKAMQTMMTERSEWENQEYPLSPLYIFNPFPPNDKIIGFYEYPVEQRTQSLASSFLESILPGGESMIRRLIQTITNIGNSSDSHIENEN